MNSKLLLLSVSLFFVTTQFFGQTITEVVDFCHQNSTINKSNSGPNIQPEFKSKLEITEVLRLKLTCDANSYSDETFVIFNNSDPSQGAEKLMSMYTNAPELWTVKKGLNYSISFLGGLDSTMSVPITVKAGMPGIYNISAIQLASFGANIEIRLEDRVKGCMINLGILPEYTFEVSEADTIADRFYLNFVEVVPDPYKTITSISENVTVKPFKIYAADGNIKILSLQQLSGKVAVFDLLGHRIAVGNVNAGANTQIDMNDKTGVYIVSIQSSKGISNTKILVR